MMEDPDRHGDALPTALELASAERALEYISGGGGSNRRQERAAARAERRAASRRRIKAHMTTDRLLRTKANRTR